MKKIIAAAVLLMGTSAFACEVPESCQLNQNKANGAINVVATVATIADALEVDTDSPSVTTRAANDQLQADLNAIGLGDLQVIINSEPGIKCATAIYSVINAVAQNDETIGRIPLQYTEGVIELAPDFFTTVSILPFRSEDSNKVTYVAFNYYGKADNGKDLCTLNRIVPVNKN